MSPHLATFSETPRYAAGMSACNTLQMLMIVNTFCPEPIAAQQRHCTHDSRCNAPSSPSQQDNFVAVHAAQHISHTLPVVLCNAHTSSTLKARDRQWAETTDARCTGSTRLASPAAAQGIPGQSQGQCNDSREAVLCPCHCTSTR
jgi:hypothetical protein